MDPAQLRWWDGTGWTQQVGQPQHPVAQAGPTGTRFATFWERAFALVLDSVLLGIPLGIMFLAYGWDAFASYLGAVADAAEAGGEPDAVDTGELFRTVFVFSLFANAVNAAYFIGMLGRSGRTFGQRAMRIKVVDVHGARPTYGMAGKRWVIPGGLALVGAIPTVGTLGSLALLVDYLSMLWDKQKQCWHDKFARTWVVHETERSDGPY